MIAPAKRAISTIAVRVSAYAPEHKDARILEGIERNSPPQPAALRREHVDEAIAWIKRAQDVAGTGGVPWGYRARRGWRSESPLGWIAPYPETTGYIIPTMLAYGELTGDRDSIERARRMTDWEVSIQLADGSFQGGIIGTKPVAPSTFVTGQVIFGLVAANRRFGQKRYIESGKRAGDFLLNCLDDQGRFVKGHSLLCAPGAKAYEVRTGLALLQLGELTGDQRYVTAASRMADYALACRKPNGWFAENDLNDNSQPLTHTIGYVLEGLQGIGFGLNRRDCLDAVDASLQRLAALVEENGFLAGRWRSDWTPGVNWACLTGSAQIAGVFERMHQRFPNPLYRETARRLLGFVAATQEMAKDSVPGLKGGIRGSFPFAGLYGQWCVLNWATKFFCDSMMDHLAGADGSGKETDPRSTAQPVG